MKRLVFTLFVLLLLVSCTNNVVDAENDKYLRYQHYYENILDNLNFSQNSAFYDLEVVMNRLNDGTYRYDIILDNPQIAMYDVEIMTVENNTKYEAATKMFPCFGIFEDQEYNLVPYQVNFEEGYVKGIIISGISGNSTLNIKIRVSWKDYSKVNETKEYLELNVSVN